MIITKYIYVLNVIKSKLARPLKSTFTLDWFGTFFPTAECYYISITVNTLVGIPVGLGQLRL